MKASDALNMVPIGSSEEERDRAKSWMNFAAQQCRNCDYYKNQRDRALDIMERLCRTFGDSAMAIEAEKLLEECGR